MADTDAVFAGLTDVGQDKLISDAAPTVQDDSTNYPIGRTEANQDDDEEVFDLLADDLVRLES